MVTCIDNDVVILAVVGLVDGKDFLVREDLDSQRVQLFELVEEPLATLQSNVFEAIC